MVQGSQFGSQGRNEGDEPVNDTIQYLLSQLHTSYVHGASCPPPQFTLDNYEVKLHKQLYADIQNRLTPLEMKLLSRCSGAYSKGVAAARGNQITLACRYLGEARLVSESPKLSAEGRMLARSFLAAAEAYLDYRCEDFEQARQQLCESLAADEILETTYGHAILHVHRLHLVNNLVRVEVQRGNVEGALDMAARLLCYMEGKSDDAPAPGLWGPSFRLALSTEAITAMFVQVIGEVGQALAGKTPDVARDLFVILEKQLSEPDSSLWHPLALEWFNVKRAFVGESIEQYLRVSSEYLVKGVLVAPTLWRMVVLDVLIATEDMPITEAGELRRDILRDASRWRGTSTKLRCLVKDLCAAFEELLPVETITDAREEPRSTS